MTESQVYWWLMLDNFHGDGGLQVGMVFLFGILGGGILFWLAGNWEPAKNAYGDPYVTNPKFAGGLALINLFFWVFLACATNFIPTSKQYALIKILPKVANSDFAKQVPSDMVDMYNVAKTYMKEKLTDESKPRKTS